MKLRSLIDKIGIPTAVANIPFHFLIFLRDSPSRTLIVVAKAFAALFYLSEKL
jgi:uncharacterized membrane protein YpjA